VSDNSRSANADGFIGAAGGSIIGDLIFPGLGTVGGALVGFLGGKDYGKHRKWREERRDREQGRWEAKYGDERSRDGSRDGYRDRSGSREYRDKEEIQYGGRRESHVGKDGLVHSHIRKPEFNWEK
jgi:hypothetical protein